VRAEFGPAMLHAGVLKKFGLYGLIQIALPLLPAGGTTARHHSVAWLPDITRPGPGCWPGWLLGNVLVSGLVTMAQRDLKQMNRYSSVMHMVHALGIASLSVSGPERRDAHVRPLCRSRCYSVATSIHHRNADVRF